MRRPRQVGQLRDRAVVAAANQILRLASPQYRRTLADATRLGMITAKVLHDSRPQGPAAHDGQVVRTLSDHERALLDAALPGMTVFDPATGTTSQPAAGGAS